MRFLAGPGPIRRTLKYLNEGKIIFRPHVKIFTVHYNKFGKHHEGARKFAFWHLPQIIHNNPDVQCVVFTDMTPLPFIRIFTDDGKSVLIDLDSRDLDDIRRHLENFAAVCKTQKEMTQEIKDLKSSIPSYFGYHCMRHCMCEVLGQVPCPTIIRLPYSWRGSTVYKEDFHIPPKYMEPGLEDNESMCGFRFEEGFIYI